MEDILFYMNMRRAAQRVKGVKRVKRVRRVRRVTDEESEESEESEVFTVAFCERRLGVHLPLLMFLRYPLGSGDGDFAGAVHGHLFMNLRTAYIAS